MIYEEIAEEVQLPKNGKIGKAKDSVGYTSDGEASDWMLHELGIIAMSPELGSASVTSMTFDIASSMEEAQIILENMDLPQYIIRKTGPQLDMEAGEAV